MSAVHKNSWRFARHWPSLLAVVAVLFAVRCETSALAAEKNVEPGFKHAALIHLEGMITPQVEHFMYRKLEDAREQGADLVVIEIESPGGHLEQSQRLAEHLRDNVGWAHTVAYIPREALSGGAIVALACDEVVMDKQALMGDAGPIIQDEGFLFKHADEKFVTHFAAWMRVLAESKGRPPRLLEAMVDRNLEVFRVENRKTGEVKFLGDKEADAFRGSDEWTVERVVESEKGRFLEVSGSRAVALQLADKTVESREELQRYLGVDRFYNIDRNWVDAAVRLLNSWPVTALLIVGGLIALYVEFSAPGISVGGLIAGLCFLLFFWSRFLGGTAGWLEVILFVAGVVFVAMEIFVIPGFGGAGILGLLLMVASAVLAGQTFVIPNTTNQLSTLTASFLVVLGSGVAFIVALAFLSRHFGKLPLFGRLVLAPPTSKPSEPVSKDKASKESSPTGNHCFAASAGDWGKAETPLRPAGKIWIGDELVDVVTDGGFIEKGRNVRVVEVSGNRVVVREVEESG